MRTLVKTTIAVVVMGLTLVSCDSNSYSEEKALYKSGTEGNGQDNPDERDTGNK